MHNKTIKKVLSIDMDFLMGPCINLYNDCAGNEEFHKGNYWEQLNIIRGIDKHLSYDENKLVLIIELLATQLRKLSEDKFFFAEEHDMILEHLCREDNKNEIFDIYNLDHHHDIYYAPEQKSEVDRFDFACLANWVYYLGKNEKINKYYWVRNENSMAFPFEELRELTFPVDTDTYYRDLERLISEVDFDYVFICRSSEYFPDKYNYLFDALLAMARAVKGWDYAVWNKPYCVDGKSRPTPK